VHNYPKLNKIISSTIWN